MNPNWRPAFSLSHLFWFVASVCLALSLFQFSHSVGIIAAPFAVSLPVSHAVSPTLSAKVSGLVASLFWTFVILPVFLAVVFNFGLFDKIDRGSIGEVMACWVFAIVSGASVLGGYLGGQTSIH